MIFSGLRKMGWRRDWRWVLTMGRKHGDGGAMGMEALAVGRVSSMDELGRPWQSVVVNHTRWHRGMAPALA